MRGKHTTYVRRPSKLIVCLIYKKYLHLYYFALAILLGHLKLPFGKIKEAVLACDGTILSEQHLMQMEAFAPDQKEVSCSLAALMFLLH